MSYYSGAPPWVYKKRIMTKLLHMKYKYLY